MELLDTISKQIGPDDEVAVHVVTAEDQLNNDRQTENFQWMVDAHGAQVLPQAIVIQMKT